MKFTFALIYEKVFNKWRIMTNKYSMGRITPEEYERDYGKNLPNIQLRCPYTGLNGEPCNTVLEFTPTSDRACAFFSTKDNHEHVYGCMQTTNGKKRKQTNKDFIRKDLDFNMFFCSVSHGGDDDYDVEDEDENNDFDYLDDRSVEENCSDVGSEDDFDKDDTSYDDDINDDASEYESCEDSESQKGRLHLANSEQLKGFNKIAALALAAAPQDAATNEYLVVDSTICARTAMAFNEGLIELKKGDPMLLVVRKWGKFSYDYRDEIGPNSLFFRNLYIEKEFEHVFELKIDKLSERQRKKFFKLYKKDEKKNYDPQAFIMGVIYVGTRNAVIGGRVRHIDTFSLQNVSCFMEFNDKLKEIDDNNMRV